MLPKRPSIYLILVVFAALSSCSIMHTNRNLRDGASERYRADLLDGLVVSERPTTHTLGYEIAYFKTPESANVRLIILPGAPSQHRFWARFAKALTSEMDIQVFAIERPGYGASFHGSAVTDFAGQSDAAAAFLATGTETCNFVLGSSYAAPIALK